MREHPSVDLISVVIPSYNHGHYLKDAINSVTSQTYRPLEIIVVDDGSIDNTAVVAASFPEVKYYKQENSGLSAARNKGLLNCNGDYVVFLDADDILVPECIAINHNLIKVNSDYAFVSGGYRLITEKSKLLPDPILTTIEKDHYVEMLKGNYIGMHATVLYDKKKLINVGGFKTSFRACEDYDIYLRLTSHYPVLCHSQRIALYRMHESNMSRNSLLMMKYALLALKEQEANIMEDEKAIDAYKHGIKAWTDYYLRRYFVGKFKIKITEELALINEMKSVNPNIYSIYLNLKMKSVIKRLIPGSTKRWMYQKGWIKYNNPAIGQIDIGDFRRTVPFSRYFGYDRGGPIDRYFIESFLQKNSDCIKNHVLEIGDNEYTLKYGGDKVKKSDVLHVQKENPNATIIGDLSNADHIPSNTFDCFVFTQTLHLIYDFKAALRTCYRILKPGGVLLLTVPGISQKDSGEWEDNWLWAFTSKSMKLLLEETFSDEGVEVEINSHGNVLTSSAFLYGMGVGELTKEELDYNDDCYQQIITVKAIKPL